MFYSEFHDYKKGYNYYNIRLYTYTHTYLNLGQITYKHPLVEIFCCRDFAISNQSEASTNLITKLYLCKENTNTYKHVAREDKLS